MSANPTDARSVEELVAAIKAGAQPEYLYFWGHQPKQFGLVDKSCLSNWFPAKFSVDGVTYQTAEHYVMARKARLFGDEDSFSLIVAAKSPGEAKALGRGVRDFDEAKWLDHRFEIMVDSCREKFGANEALGSYLHSTGTKVLVEASPQDRIWGIGLAVDDLRSAQPTEWLGLNLLGFALMEARARLAVGG